MGRAGWKKAALTVAGLVGLGFALFAFGYLIVHNRDTIRVSYGAALAAFAASLAVGAALVAGAVVRKRRRVTLDEGGIRYREHGKRRYLPFGEVRDARLCASVSGATLLEVETHDGAERRFPLQGDAQATFATILDRLDKAQRRPRTAGGHMARGGRSLEAWVGALAECARPGGYRDAALDPAQLRARFEDLSLPEDVRAAAAFLIAASGDDDARARLFGAIDAASAPLVVVLAALGARDTSAVEEGVCEAALAFLEPADRDAARAHLAHARDDAKTANTGGRRIALATGADEARARDEALAADEARAGDEAALDDAAQKDVRASRGAI